MKKYLLLVTALAAMVGCSDETFVGDQSLKEANENAAISFTSGSKTMTRATGADAAALLNNNFVVYGYKTVGGTPALVFDNYQVNWITNTAATTESNSADWEYVGYKNLPFGTTTASGGELNNNGVAANASGSSTNIDQSIKYWDFSASAYDFFAYSLGTGHDHDSDPSTALQYAKASAMTNSTYSLEGTAAQLGTCYISNKKNVVPSASATEVDLEFLSFLSKIELKFYETIPGYSVKSLSFYPSSDGEAGTTPYLYASSEVLPTGGKYTVTFDANGKAQLTLADSDPAPTKVDKTTAFETTLTNYKGAEYKEANFAYLGRASNDATTTNTISMLPNPQNTNALNLKMDFTLVSRDGTGEEISCTGATAVVPAAYAKWLPNYKYTYIFKISDNTNVQIGAITGLYPITLDAVVTEAEDGVQETITTVSTPSITTYAKGKIVTANDEYIASVPIYVIVYNGTAYETLTSKANLYTVTLAASTDNGDTPEANAAQSISEESVANALANGTKDNDSNPTTWTVKDAHKWKMVVTKSNLMTLVNAIADADSPTGQEITIGDAKVGKFIPTAETNYVFQYEVEAPVAAGTYDATSAAAYNATLPGAISTSDVAYSFNSYGSADDSTPHGTGKVKVVSQDGGWTTVLVTSNTPVDQNAANFVGQQFKVYATTLSSGTYYPLYTIGSTPTGIYVTVAASTFNETEVNTYNATLTDAVSVGGTKPAIPGKYQYKVIKVAPATPVTP